MQNFLLEKPKVLTLTRPHLASSPTLPNYQRTNRIQNPPDAEELARFINGDFHPVVDQRGRLARRWPVAISAHCLALVSPAARNSPAHCTAGSQECIIVDPSASLQSGTARGAAASPSEESGTADPLSNEIFRTKINEWDARRSTAVRPGPPRGFSPGVFYRPAERIPPAGLFAAVN